jgi:hypothetical protein
MLKAASPGLPALFYVPPASKQVAQYANRSGKALSKIEVKQHIVYDI